jgi:hypothetical protein
MASNGGYPGAARGEEPTRNDPVLGCWSDIGQGHRALPRFVAAPVLQILVQRRNCQQSATLVLTYINALRLLEGVIVGFFC